MTNDDLRTAVYPVSKKDDARKDIFLTLLINNASLAYEQMKLNIFSSKQKQAFGRHLRAEFEGNKDLRRRLENTKNAYNPDFVSLMLDP